MQRCLRGGQFRNGQMARSAIDNCESPDSSVGRALERKSRGPGFDPGRCLPIFRFGIGHLSREIPTIGGSGEIGRGLNGLH